MSIFKEDIKSFKAPVLNQNDRRVRESIERCREAQKAIVELKKIDYSALKNTYINI